MSLSTAIFTAAVLSAIFRIAPIFLKIFSLEKYKSFVGFLDYAGCAAIGGMIYLATFPENQYITKLQIINIFILLLAFVLSLKLRKPLFVFIISILIYAAVLFCTGLMNDTINS